MATTIPYSTTLHPGTPLSLGPASIPTGLTQVSILVDRSVSGGLNSLPSSSVLALEVDISFDGGNTWELLMASTQAGGPMPPGTPNPTGPSTDLPQPGNPNRMARGTVTASGPSNIVVTGTLNLS